MKFIPMYVTGLWLLVYRGWFIQDPSNQFPMERRQKNKNVSIRIYYYTLLLLSRHCGRRWISVDDNTMMVVYIRVYYTYGFKFWITSCNEKNIFGMGKKKSGSHIIWLSKYKKYTNITSVEVYLGENFRLELLQDM